MSELLAEQSHRDRVRTADLRLDDRAKRELADDDSMKESDWFDRTSINPKVFRSQKDAEYELKERQTKCPLRFVRQIRSDAYVAENYFGS